MLIYGERNALFTGDVEAFLDWSSQLQRAFEEFSHEVKAKVGLCASCPHKQRGTNAYMSQYQCTVNNVA